MHYYFFDSSHKADLNLSHLCSHGNFLGSSVEVYLDSVNMDLFFLLSITRCWTMAILMVTTPKVTSQKLVELDELGVFSMIHLVEIVEKVGLSILLRPLFIESRVCFELELHFEYPAPLYLFFLFYLVIEAWYLHFKLY